MNFGFILYRATLYDQTRIHYTGPAQYSDKTECLDKTDEIQLKLKLARLRKMVFSKPEALKNSERIYSALPLMLRFGQRQRNHRPIYFGG